MDKEVLMILNDCDLLQYFSKFKGITMAELRELTPEQVKAKLMTLITSAIDADAIALEVAKRNAIIKNEAIDVKPDITSTIVQDDDEPMIVHQVPGDVSFVAVDIKTEKTVEEVTIDDDDDDETMTESLEEADTNDGSSASETPAFPLPQCRFVPSASTLKMCTAAAQLNILFSGREMSDYTQANPPDKRRKVELAETRSQSVKTRSQSAKTRSQSADAQNKMWKSIYGACGPAMIRMVDCDDWEWGPLDGPSPRNLYQLLSRHCHNLTQLTFSSNLTLPSTFSGSLTLPNLKVIKVQPFTDLFTFPSILRDVIQATAGRLQTLEFSCGCSGSLMPFLKSMESASGPQSGLRGLKSLSILNKCSADSLVLTNGFLVLANEDFKILGSLTCHDLRDLYLDCSVADDVQAPFEAFLKSVPKLRTFTLTGCFRGVRSTRLMLTFPVLKFLKELVLGPSLIKDSPCDDLLSRPRKRCPRKPFRQLRLENEEAQGQERQLRVTVEVSVTVSLPIFPKLELLRLGRFFEIDELHFRSFPNLTRFRVSSPWQLALRFPTDIAQNRTFPTDSVQNRTFPTDTGRIRTFPNIFSLQLPDQLEDDDFVRAVLPLFPNLQFLWVHLPTVKVVRAVAWAMKSVKSLMYSLIVTQFDFVASLDMCLVDRPSDVVMSREEVQKVDTLKKYKYWREFVDFHGIDLPNSGREMPNTGNTMPSSELDDETKYAGLSALDKNVLNKNRFVLELRHAARRLRLPTGDLHWDDGACAFGDTLIGFQRFPVSPTVETAAQILEINFAGFENKVHQLPRGFMASKDPFLFVDPCTATYMGVRKGDET